MALPIYFGICLVYPPLCHAIAPFIGDLAVRLYTTAISDIDAKHMPRMAGELIAPPVAQWFYGLEANPPFRDVLLCIRADDVFHTAFNEVCYEMHCAHPVASIARHLELHGKGQ